MRIGLTRTKQLLIDRGVAVVAAIIRDEIKPEKFGCPQNIFHDRTKQKQNVDGGKKMFAESRTLTK
jgi:hypothetical protein